MFKKVLHLFTMILDVALSSSVASVQMHFDNLHIKGVICNSNIIFQASKPVDYPKIDIRGRQTLHSRPYLTCLLII